MTRLGLTTRRSADRLTKDSRGDPRPSRRCGIRAERRGRCRLIRARSSRSHGRGSLSAAMIQQRPAGDAVDRSGHRRRFAVRGQVLRCGNGDPDCPSLARCPKGSSGNAACDARQGHHSAPSIHSPPISGYWTTCPNLELWTSSKRLVWLTLKPCSDPFGVSLFRYAHDCTDGMLCASGAVRLLLDPKVRRSMSSFWKIGDVTEPLRRLEDDLQSREWERKYSHFLDRESC